MVLPMSPALVVCLKTASIPCRREICCAGRGASLVKVLEPLAVDAEQLDVIGPRQQRQRISERACGRRAAVPGDEHIVQARGAVLDIGDDEDRPAGAEHHGFDGAAAAFRLIGIGLLDDHEIE